MEDLTLRILLAAGLISIVLGLTVDDNKAEGWIEGFAICLAVFIVVIVTAVNDF